MQLNAGRYATGRKTEPPYRVCHAVALTGAKRLSAVLDRSERSAGLYEILILIGVTSEYLTAHVVESLVLCVDRV